MTEAAGTAQDLDAAIEGYREALREYVRGDPEPVAGFFSTREDVTLANPLGPPRRGPAEVRKGIVEGGTHFMEGGSLRFAQVTSRFEEVSRYAAPELAYVVQLERLEGRRSADGETVRISLRVTMIFRQEDGVWRVAHRHADPITSVRSIDTAVEG